MSGHGGVDREELFGRYTITIRRDGAGGRLELWEGGFLGSVHGDSCAELLAKLLEEQAEHLQDIHDRLRALDALFLSEAVTERGEMVGEVSLKQAGRMVRSITHDLDPHPSFVERLAGFVAGSGFTISGPGPDEVPIRPPTMAERLAAAER